MFLNCSHIGCVPYGFPIQSKRYIIYSIIGYTYIIPIFKKRKLVLRIRYTVDYLSTIPAACSAFAAAFAAAAAAGFAEGELVGIW